MGLRRRKTAAREEKTWQTSVLFLRRKKKKKGPSLALLKEYRRRVNAFRDKDIGRRFMNNILRTK